MHLSEFELRKIIEEGLDSLNLDSRRVLLIIPDSTRTAPIGQLFRMIHGHLRGQVRTFDVAIALGTHPPMTEAEIRGRLEISVEEREREFRSVQFLNHHWDDPSQLMTIGRLEPAEIEEITDGRFRLGVDVSINRRVADYDQLIILGPVFPHEVAGFSGGAKYLFPGLSGPELLNFFHWLGASVTNLGIIGHKWTAVREVIHRAARMVPTPCHCFCVVVEGTGAAALFSGAVEEAWSDAADLSSQLHVITTDRQYSTVLSCAPSMYTDLWVGGKCMYKLESVVQNGGELIIYAPHIHQVSPTHGVVIERLGYHVYDYFAKQWDKFELEPWGVLAHLTHVKGLGSYENGVELPRIQVTLATGIDEGMCRRLNLGYRDPASIEPSDFADRESEGILKVDKAGETLYRYEPVTV